uniref:Succinate dehydrogenase assembly factor 4, mitochondrial n=1 Tax=Trichogramma kaykai TaxID=54128 RepID=A0ABD2XB02_9HYME
MLSRTLRYHRNLVNSCQIHTKSSLFAESNEKSKESTRLKEFRKKLQEKPPIGGFTIDNDKKENLVDSNKLRARAPLKGIEELEEGQHPYQEKEPLEPFPNSVNPVTGELGGPRGPEPTRYGDWERKGRVSDF